MIAWSTSYDFNKAAQALELLETMSDSYVEVVIEHIKRDSPVYLPALAEETGYSMAELKDVMHRLSRLGLVCPSPGKPDTYVFNYYRYLRLVILTSQVVGTKASVAKF